MKSINPKKSDVYLLFLIFSLCVSANIYGDDFTGWPASDVSFLPSTETVLKDGGYNLNEESMRSILKNPVNARLIEKIACLEYVEKENMVSLVLDVENYYNSLVDQLDKMKKRIDEKGISKEERHSRIEQYESLELRLESLMMLSIECLFAIDQSMSKRKKAEYLQRVRYSLFERRMPESKNPPSSAMYALVSAWHHQNVNIKNDLIALIKSDRLLQSTYPIYGLFKQYGDQVSERELNKILDVLQKEESAMAKIFLKLAHDRGKLLDRKVADSNQH